MVRGIRQISRPNYTQNLYLQNNISEPLKLSGEGEYNLNVLTEIEVTESYLGMNEEDRNCQDVEPFYNCTSRQYRDTILAQCGCLPLSMNLSNDIKVKFNILH